jgi:hypothetical protein
VTLLRPFYGRHNEVINRGEVSVSQIITIRSILLSFMTCQLVCKKSNTTVVNSRAGNAYLFKTPEISPVLVA